MERIPTEEDWGDYQADRDTKYAYDQFIGRTNSEMIPRFKENVLMRVEDLGWMPIKPFQYYMLGFRDYVIGKDFGDYEDADAASTFLHLVLHKLKEQPEFVNSLMDDLMSDIEFVASNQLLYDADEDIYGNFLDLLNKIKETYQKSA